MTVTFPNGQTYTSSLFAGAQAPPTHGATVFFLPVEAGSTVTVAQATALTGGASVLFAELWGS
jgi:hypothetical protein